LALDETRRNPTSVRKLADHNAASKQVGAAKIKVMSQFERAPWPPMGLLTGGLAALHI
jgi:hypothetical protein